MEIKERVITVISDQLGIGKKEIKPEDAFAEDLGADSFDSVEIIMAIEEEFDVEISDDAAENIETVQQLVDVVTELAG